jgi:hypothetical protein
MRDRNTRFHKSLAARSIGRGLGVSTACLIAGIATAQAQTASSENTRIERIPLRGTTTASTPQSAGAYGTSTLYGALPANRGNAGEAQPEYTSGVFGSTAAATPAQSGLITGSTPTIEETEQADADFVASLARQNPRTETVDGLPVAPVADPDGVPGFMIGTLTLRPTLSQRVVHESVRSNGTSTSKVFSETTLSGTVFSDWARHQLSVTGSGTWQKKLSGTGTESPNANLDALLRLDLINDITATLGAGYSYSEENETDPNAISGASAQSGIHEARASFGLQKQLGVLRGTSTVEVTRTMYGSATLAGGGSVPANDRDTIGVEFTSRIGYAISPALLPFIEASVAREKYDQKIDSTGAERSSTTYGIRAGAEIDLGEKLTGEIAAGFLRRSLDDASLSDISGLTLDGDLTWSPQRGTEINLGLATTVEAATTAGEAGAVVYEFDSSLTHELNSNLLARLGATYEYRDYDSGSNRNNQLGYGASAGLTWSINRYLDLDADASYEKVEEPGRTDEETVRVGLGLRLRR